MKSIELYEKLTGKIEEYEAKLLSAYGRHIKCARGCSSCCILESVFPVEAYNIYITVTGGGSTDALKASGGESGRCVFLSGGACSVYGCRPVICRTHGYPIMAEGKIDFCIENFKDINNIDSGYILDIEALNRALVSINRIFLRENSDEFFGGDRILLADLKQRILLNV